jgi:hypothetical protein
MLFSESNSEAEVEPGPDNEHKPTATKEHPEERALPFNIQLPKFNFLKMKFDWMCEDSWDCDYPEMCCDFKLFKACCRQRIPVSTWDPFNPELLPIPVYTDEEEARRKNGV